MSRRKRQNDKTDKKTAHYKERDLFTSGLPKGFEYLGRPLTSEEQEKLDYLMDKPEDFSIGKASSYTFGLALDAFYCTKPTFHPILSTSKSGASFVESADAFLYEEPTVLKDPTMEEVLSTMEAHQMLPIFLDLRHSKEIVDEVFRLIETGTTDERRGWHGAAFIEGYSKDMADALSKDLLKRVEKRARRMRDFLQPYRGLAGRNYLSLHGLAWGKRPVFLDLDAPDGPELFEHYTGRKPY